MLLLFATLVLAATAPSTAAPVRDTNGKPLLPGSEYYVLPVIRGRGGGLTLADRDNNSCPLGVAQERLEVSSGVPLKFRPANPNSTAVQLSEDVNVEFSAVTTCVQSTVWTLARGEAGARTYVVSGGVAGSPGPATLSNWFSVAEACTGRRDYYKLVFCPTVCIFCKPACGDVGVFVEEGGRWLGLRGGFFPVMFKKV